MRALILLVLCILVIFAGLLMHQYAPAPERVWTAENALTPIVPLSFSDDGDEESLLTALAESRAYFMARPRDAVVRYGGAKVTAAEMTAFLDELRQVISVHGIGTTLTKTLAERALFFEPASKNAFFTGYYEAQLRGSRKSSERFAHPLYARPSDLAVANLSQFFSDLPAGLPHQLRGRLVGTQLIPYYSRHEIDAKGVLAQRNLEIVWTDDPIEAFFLHIQGSGKVVLDDGTTIRVGYAEKNGQAYRAVGALMKERNMITPPVTMRKIKDYLRAHPEAQREVFDYNPSYVFFEERSTGPVGNIGRVLTPLRSIAADSNLLPKGVPALIRITLPATTKSPERVLQRMVFIQDTGGAIRGPGRVDLFTGAGEEAEELAGPLQSKGELYLLAPLSGRG